MKVLQMVQNVQRIFQILEILIEIIDDAWKFTMKFGYTEWPNEKISKDLIKISEIIMSNKKAVMDLKRKIG